MKKDLYNAIRSVVVDQTLKSTEDTVEIVFFNPFALIKHKLVAGKSDVLFLKRNATSTR